MAATGAWTKSAYDRLLAHINGMKDKATRDLVLDMVLRPETKVFDRTVSGEFPRLVDRED
jgi:hypothetical protein